MHFRLRLTLLLIMVAVGFFFLGAVAGSIVAKNDVFHNQSYIGSSAAQPNSELSFQNYTILQPYTQLGINLNSSQPITLNVDLNGSMQFSTKGTQINYHYMLAQTGSWEVIISNNNTETASLDYQITITRITYESTAPFISLLSPVFISGEVALIAILPVNFYGDIKKRWSKSVTEILVFSILAILAFGFMPILSFATGVSNPLVTPPTTSMVPTIKPGDLVLLQKVDSSKLNVGDIICYNALTQQIGQPSTPISPYPIIHRINQVYWVNGTRYFVTKGDNNAAPDTWYVPENAVIGKAVLVVPYMGEVFTWLSQTYVKIPAIAIILTIIVLWPTKKGDNNKKRK